MWPTKCIALQEQLSPIQVFSWRLGDNLPQKLYSLQHVTPSILMSPLTWKSSYKLWWIFTTNCLCKIYYNLSNYFCFISNWRMTNIGFVWRLVFRLPRWTSKRVCQISLIKMPRAMLSLLIENMTQTYKNNIQVFMKSPFPFKVETFCFNFPPVACLPHARQPVPGLDLWAEHPDCL